MTAPVRPPIICQHEETEIRELVGARCQAFLAVSSTARSEANLMYLQLDDQWHRFYLDVGVLFWKEGPAPDEDDDLLTDEMYVDWGKQLQVIGIAVSEIAMADSTLNIRFQNGAKVVVKQHGPLTEMNTIVQLTRPPGV